MDSFWKGPVRAIQTNLRISDAIGLDPEALIETVDDYNANVLVVNAGGLVTWYESQVSTTRMNENLDYDFVQKVQDAAHRKGMKVIFRFDVSNITQEEFSAHPDWAKRDGEGKPAYEMGLVQSCVNSPVYQDYNLRLLDEFTEKYHPDGIFYNAIHYGFCHCDRCRELYKQETGTDLPDKLLMDTEEGRRFMKYRYEKTGELMMQMRRRIEQHSPDTLLMHCGMICTERPIFASLSGWDGKLISEAEEVLFNETVTNVSRPQPFWSYLPGENALACNAIGKKTLICIHQACQNGRNAVSAPAHFIYDMAQAAFHGGIPSPVQIGTFDVEDRKDLGPMKEFFRFLRENGDCFTDYRVRNKVALIYSQKTNDYDGFKDQTAYTPLSLFMMGLTKPNECGDEYRGVYEALVHSHTPFEVLHDGFIEETDLSGYLFIILPGVTCLSEAAAEKIDRFVEDGGRLIITGQLPTKDAMGRETGSRLRSIPFRVTKKGFAFGNLLMSDKSLFPSLPDTDLVGIVCKMSSLSEENIEGLVKDLQRREWPKISKVEYSDICEMSNDYGLYLYPYGEGQVVLLPWALGQMYRNQGIYECPRVLKDLMKHIGFEEDVMTDAPYSVELVQATSKAGEMICLINSTGIGGKVRLEQIPVHSVSVKVRTEGTRAFSRVTNREYPAARQDGYLEFTIPRIDDFELIVID